MNTLEVKTKKSIKSFSDIYRIAKKQFLDYEKIEGINNWKDYDFSIDCSEDQFKFKDMLQIRFIEELCEASEALNESEHFWEEITDSLNFFLSAYIMTGIDLNKMPDPSIYLKSSDKRNIPDFKRYSEITYLLIHDVGCLCNLLKNRPWAQSNYLVSMLDFNQRLEKLWIDYWRWIGQLGISKNVLFDLFERKVIVNKWRMETGY